MMYKLGSLFDGVAGFPLAGSRHGITPVWASEIEPFPIKVTTLRFPDMKHLGDITKIKGADIEPVDVITFGSPCQDLSIAGKQAGIHDGARSNLFFEAVRIIREMREATHDRYPRIAVWENVPGAFSSNKGEDFRCVLEALCQVADKTVSIPRPPKGKWTTAGEIVGDGYSVAYRTIDAQYFGVPQRRRRIYLVADFGSERAGEVLFVEDGLRGDSAQGEAQGQGVAGNTEGGVGGSCWPDVTGSILARADGSPCVDREQPFTVYCLQGNGIDRADTAGCNGNGWREGQSYTLNTIDRPAVVYTIDSDASNSMKSGNPHSGFHETQIARCLDTTNPDPSKNQGGNVVVYDARGNEDGKIAATVTGDHENRITDYTNVVTLPAKPPRKYIVRRLTPLECTRLQGYHDWWLDIPGASDSAKYKALGNSLAIPCADFVMAGVARILTDHATSAGRSEG